MNGRVFVGFGFGAIQAGLFLYEAFRSGRFRRLVVAEVMPEAVAAVRGAGGGYAVNIATATGLEHATVSGVEILNPLEPSDRARLVDAIAEAGELATALPSVAFFDRGEASVARLLAEGLQRKAADAGKPRAVLYAGENHNHAAELLREACARQVGAKAGAALARIDFLNTVIGKMSGVVAEPEALRRDGLAPMTPGAGRAFLVEAFNRILVSRVRWPGFERGLGMFVEKDDLLPFEEAKLYGHNAVHALLGFLAHEAGRAYMSDAAADAGLMDAARAAFLDESGAGVRARHAGTDPLFTAEGWRAYTEDLLARMTNPWLRDRVDRILRDPRRKLGWDDRLIGTMRFALDAGVTPARFARAAALAARRLATETPGANTEDLLREIWAPAADTPPGRKAKLLRLIERAL